MASAEAMDNATLPPWLGLGYSQWIPAFMVRVRVRVRVRVGARVRVKVILPQTTHHGIQGSPPP